MGKNTQTPSFGSSWLWTDSISSASSHKRKTYTQEQKRLRDMQPSLELCALFGIFPALKTPSELRKEKDSDGRRDTKVKSPKEQLAKLARSYKV